MALLATAIAAISLSSQSMPSSETPCPPGPLPATIKSAGAEPLGVSEMLEFSATPSFSREPWVVRIFRRGQIDAAIQIIRLKQELDCNRYHIYERWEFRLKQEEFGNISTKIAPFAIPSANVFTSLTPPRSPEVVTDGTALVLGLRSQDWQVKRTLNRNSRDGTDISAFFHTLVSKYIPASAVPTNEWTAH